MTKLCKICSILMVLIANASLGTAQSNSTTSSNRTSAPTDLTSAVSTNSTSPPTTHPTALLTTGITNTSTLGPTFAPTSPPSDTATNEPTVPAATLPSDNPSPPPSPRPSPLVVTPSDAPTKATPAGTDTPTTYPTVPPISPSKRPSRSPTRNPSNSKTDQPTDSPTGTPIRVPTVRPTIGGTLERTLITDINLTFTDVTELSTVDIAEFQSITNAWFDEFFNNSTRTRMLGRMLKGAEGIRRMSSIINVTGQNFPSGNNIITYNQRLNYIQTADNAPNATQLISLPFQNLIANADYATRLRQNIQAFSNVAEPIAAPEVTNTQPAPPTPETDNGGLSLAAIIGIAVGGAVLCALLLLLAMRSMNSDKDGTGYIDSGSLPPTQFNINAAEEVSVIEDPTVVKMGSGNMSVGQYGDQSVATVDYDYSKAYGGGGNASVVSSVGGTLGDNTRQTAGDPANSARLALGANFESDLQNEFREEIIVIDAPAGKLGVVIDTPDDGAPVVHAVKDSSVIADQIQVGDKLIAVDDDDVRSMSAIKVSKLISKKSANPSRKLTIVRQVHVDHR